MATKIGYNCMVAWGTTRSANYGGAVRGMGTWSIDGITADQVETTEFVDNWKTFSFGSKDGGTVSFNGLLHPEQTTVQQVMLANVQNSNITSIKFYIDSTSYYMPCLTTGYFSPIYTTGYDTISSYVNITSFTVNADRTGALQVSFTGKVSGVMVLV